VAGGWPGARLAENVIERMIGVLIPPACREETLGDLRERNDGAQLFLYDALRTLPLVIYSRIRRTTDSVVFLMEAFSTYVSFVSTAWLLYPGWLAGRQGWLRLATPCALALLVLMFAGAYADPRKRWVLRSYLAVVMAFGITGVAMAVFPVLPLRLVAIGSALSMGFLLMLRALFPPIADRPQQVQGPAFWQKQELVAGGVLRVTAAIAAVLFGVSMLPDRLAAPALLTALVVGAVYFATRRT
jgi:hypothetical protein